jgi:predicted esterase
VGEYLYFISNLNGHNPLYRMKSSGSVPEPLLSPEIALQNPHHMQGISFTVFPQIRQILVMIDQDGDENYQPMLVIQGKSDPRVTEIESRELVEDLQARGHNVDYLMFEDEGHDVLKFEDRVTVYNRMTEFFREWLRP